MGNGDSRNEGIIIRAVPVSSTVSTRQWMLISMVNWLFHGIRGSTVAAYTLQNSATLTTISDVLLLLYILLHAFALRTTTEVSAIR